MAHAAKTGGLLCVSEKSPEQAAPRQPLTLRALAIGLGAGVFLAWLTPANDFWLQNTYIAGNHFPFGAFVVLLVLALPVNLALRWLRELRLPAPRPLRAGELVCVWAMLIACSGIPSSGLLRLMGPVPAGLYYYATPQNRYDDLVKPNIPKWMVLADEEAARMYYEGVPNYDPRHIPWRAWLAPALAWTTMTLGFYLITVALAALLRRQWVEREAFSFPLIDLPVELAQSAEPQPRLPAWCRSWLFWLTVALVYGVHLLAGLRKFNPSLPDPHLQTDLTGFLKQLELFGLRFRHFGWLMLKIFPMMVGITYLTRTEISFSVWFFLLFGGVLRLIRGNFGLSEGTAGLGQTTGGEQQLQAGAHLALALWIVWVAREHLGRVWRTIVGRPGGYDDRHEPLGYRWAAVLLFAGLAICLAWFFAAGAQLLWMSLTLAGTFVTIVVLSWLVTNGGIFFVQAPSLPSDLYTGNLGSKMLSPATCGVLPLWQTIYIQDPRECLLPSLLNGLRAADPVALRRSHVLGGAMLAVAAAYFFAYYTGIRLAYIQAAGTLPDRWAYVICSQRPYDLTRRLILSPLERDGTNTAYLIGAFGAVLAMLFFRARRPWFALHPAGMCIMTAYSTRWIWFSVFLGWLFKSAILRIGGMRGLRAARPFFVGLIIGDVLAGITWNIVGWIYRDPTVTYQLLPG